MRISDWSLEKLIRAGVVVTITIFPAFLASAHELASIKLDCRGQTETEDDTFLIEYVPGTASVVLDRAEYKVTQADENLISVERPSQRVVFQRNERIFINGQVFEGTTCKWDVTYSE